ncbi:hypothetical protein HDU67_009962 [Dinochytrium kinnereticum]|nr:hypothetical protein HDU67_009962 [Dinochytrium kinnereticum]
MDHPRETPEPAVVKFENESWASSTVRRASNGTDSRQLMMGRRGSLYDAGVGFEHSKIYNRPRALSRGTTTADVLSRSDLDLSKSTRPKVKILSALDPTEDEVVNVKRVELFGMPLLKRSQVGSYSVVRQTYKYQRQLKRQDKPKSFLAVASLMLDIRYYYDLMWRIVKSPGRIAIFMILDLLSDMIMSIIYLFEIQWNVTHRMDDDVRAKGAPTWLWISRPLKTFYVAVAFSCFNLISFLIRVMLADHKTSSFFSATLILEIITSIPFIIALRLDGGHLLYIPYYLRAVIAISRMKTVLRLRGATRFLNFSIITEKMILVFTTIAVVIYVALCSFQFAESNFQKDGGLLNLTLMECFYFIIVTLSTVGYGDITAKTAPGQFVVVMLIFVALSLIPGMLTALLETLSLQKAGGGTYRRGASNYVVIIGNIDNTAKMIDILENFLTEESTDQTLKVVILSRCEAPSAIKMVVNQSLYKDRVIYLVGEGLDSEDMKRFHPEGAIAVYIIGDRGAKDMRREDEQNTLRAWAIDDYTEQAGNLYISNLLPETKLYQERAAAGVICIDDIKQIVLAHTALYSGSAALLINLIHKYTPYDRYTQTWGALYGDGAGNEIYSDQINPVFDKQKFTDVASYLYHEFQVILIANPGPSYIFKSEDRYVLIAQGPQELTDIRNLTILEYQASFARDMESYALVKEGEERTQVLRPTLDRFEDSFFPAYEDTVIGTPSPHYSDANVQFCHLLRISSSLDEAAYLTAADLRPIIFICDRLPTEEEFSILSVFPKLYFIVGDPRSERDLLSAGIAFAEKVIIFSMSNQQGDQFSDSSAIMISHLIHSMTTTSGSRINVVIELEKRVHIRFLQPSSLKNARRRRKANAATRVIDQNLGYLYTPMFASGRVVVAAMLDCLLFQMSEGEDNPIVDSFRLLSGVHLRKDINLYQRHGLRSSYLRQIPLERTYHGRRFSEMFQEFVKAQGRIAIGIFRTGRNLTNRLPFVITNPLPSLILEPEDQIFII